MNLCKFKELKTYLETDYLEKKIVSQIIFFFVCKYYNIILIVKLKVYI